MYSTRPNLTLGFHGCEKSEQEKLLLNTGYIKKSTDSYDWLGHGMYFWDNNPERASLFIQAPDLTVKPISSFVSLILFVLKVYFFHATKD